MSSDRRELKQRLGLRRGREPQATGAARKRPPADRRRRLVKTADMAKVDKDGYRFIFGRKEGADHPWRLRRLTRARSRRSCPSSRTRAKPPSLGFRIRSSARDVGAAVVLEAGVGVTEDEIRDQFMTNVAAYKCSHATYGSWMCCRRLELPTPRAETTVKTGS
jgi:hypothetical protein